MAEKLKKPSHLLPFINLTFSLLLLLIIISTSSSSMAAAQLSSRDLESAIFALRANGFDLFANSIAVSDLSLQVLTHSFNSTSTSINGGIGRHGYTFLAPPNSVLFSLDMSTDAFTYVHSLRFHVIPRRLSFADLCNVSLSSEPHLETLVRGHDLFVSSSNSSSGRLRRVVVSIDGVRVSFPDIYLSSNIAVHGLDGILVSSSNEEFFHRLDSVASPPPSTIQQPPTLSPSIDAFSPRIAPASAPIDAFSPNIVGIPPFPAEFEGIPPFPAEFEGIPPYPQDFGVIPPFLDDFEGIPEDLSPINAFPPEFGAIPSSHDAAFTGGSFNPISIPPIHAYSPKSDGIPAISPDIGSIPAISPAIERIPATSPSTEFLSPNVAPSTSPPTHAEWSGAERWLSDWNAPPPRFPVEEWQEYWDNTDHKKTKKKMIMKRRKKHHLQRGHGFGEMYTEYYSELEKREN